MKKKDFINLINQNFNNKDIKEEYLLYLEKCYKIGIPFILNIEHLGKIVGIKRKILLYFILFTDKYYREFKIPKRSGKWRQINSPYPALSMVQKWILDNILSSISLNHAAKGFIKNISIKDNVLVHIHNKCLLKIDIKNYFPSIDLPRIISVFLNLGYPHKISYFLAKLCCKDECLPQGAPTSPYLSNIVSKRLDRRLDALSKLCNINYTRYADDMTFSGQYISYKFIDYVYDIINNEGFIPNEKKTKLIIGRGKKVVTGISISDNKMTIPRNKKRSLRKEAHYLLLNGIEKHCEINNEYDPILVERLIGKFNFWKFIEPNNDYVRNTLNRLINYSRELSNV
jgi:RNA-directed DNA polymerase